jgi:hypothetical protein
MVFTLGTREVAAWERADNVVTPSRRRLFRQSTSRPKWDDRTSDVGHHESPREIAAESQVEVEGQLSVSVDGGAVGSAEVVTCPFSASWYEFAGEHAEVGTRVDQETLICVPIPDK